MEDEMWHGSFVSLLMEPPKTPSVTTITTNRNKRCFDGSKKTEYEDIQLDEDEDEDDDDVFGFKNLWYNENSYPQLFRAVLIAREFPPVHTLLTDDKQSPIQKNDSSEEAFAANQSYKVDGENHHSIKKKINVAADHATENQTPDQTPVKRKNKYVWPKIDDKSKPQKPPKHVSKKNPKVSTPTRTKTRTSPPPQTPHMCPVTPPVVVKEPPRKFGSKTSRRALHFGSEDQVNEDVLLVPRKKRSKLAIIDSLIKQFLSLSCNEIEKKHTAGCSAARRGGNCECNVENEKNVDVIDIREENRVQECQCPNCCSSRTGSLVKLLTKKQRKIVETSMVPYQEKEKLALTLFKKKLVPKADIDEETIRMWDLLTMDKEVPEDEKTKAWWDKEKKVLYDHIEMFMARMRVIQGDRRFSRWKGSVVDSVIGVFLTQNVSDALSSSAFMRLAAKFQHCTDNEREEDVKDESTNNQKQNQDQNQNQSQEPDKDAKKWEEMRKKYYTGKPRDPNTLDSADWEALRRASVDEVSVVIRERGQSNVLAKRIKLFLDRIVEFHGSIDLEWLRDVPPKEVTEYLMAITGIGLKSVECIRLLCLEHHAFPVDTNVGRIAVRLGWVPLQPLPENVQIHELKKYPLLNGIQKYLWARLHDLGKRELYELHYHMITFGKVFCTKVNPNCNVCPLKESCKHFASAFASAKLRIPGPQEKARTQETNAGGQGGFTRNARMADVLLLENNNSESTNRTPTSEPIIELPESPRPASHKYLERDIEDLCLDDEEEEDDEYDDEYDDEDDDEIPTIVLNPETFRRNLLAAMEKNKLLRENSEMATALVAISPEAASIPAPKLMNLSKLRSVHQVYELDDDNPILEGYEKREPKDPCRYLFRMWTPDDADYPVHEYNDQVVLGSILIPSRTANRGSFPLNGTYFQPNEVFVDYESSHNLMAVPRELLWNQHRRTLYCGTSVTSIHRGFTELSEVQRCCYRGYYCTRGFEKKKRVPRPLPKRFHPPREKGNKKRAAKNKKTDIGKETKM